MEIDFTPWVFLDKERRSYIRVRTGPKFHVFLTMAEGFIDCVKMGIHSEQFAALIPQPTYDYQKALRIYIESTLNRTPRAVQEMTLLLDGSPDTPRRKIVAPECAEGEYTLEQLASEFNITPQVARKTLRKRMEKPAGRWVWPTPEAASLARNILAQV